MARRVNDRRQAGALILVDDNGHITSVMVIAHDDQQQAIIAGALARISKPSAWSWLRRLLWRN